MSAQQQQSGPQAKGFDVFEAARLVCDSLGVRLLGVAFGPSMAEEAESPVAPPVNLVLTAYQKECVHASSIERCVGFLSLRLV
jgi:hypothetical protein